MALGEQRYLIREYKVGIFKDTVHENNQFAHDGGIDGLSGISANSFRGQPGGESIG
jgi:hypothetical protein